MINSKNKTGFLRGKDYRVNDKIFIQIPMLEAIDELGEEKYYSMVSLICSTPSEYKVFLLDTLGMDWEEISDFDFFCMVYTMFDPQVVKMLFKGIDFQNFKLYYDNEKKEKVLYDNKNDIIIDQCLYSVMISIIRDIHELERKHDIAGTPATKRFLLDKERKLISRRRHKYNPMLPSIISALVNCQGFKYDYNTIWELNIFALMDSVRQIQRNFNYQHLMQGAYAGTVDLSKISKDEINLFGA